MTITLLVTGAPRTKKNHSTMSFRSGKPILIPSKAWSEWCRTARVFGESGSIFNYTVVKQVNCRALFYRDDKRGDAVGYYQGLADLLEKHGVVENDKLLVSWDGSRMMVDRKNPRVEVTLEVAGETE